MAKIKQLLASLAPPEKASSRQVQNLIALLEEIECSKNEIMTLNSLIDKHRKELTIAALEMKYSKNEGGRQIVAPDMEKQCGAEIVRASNSEQQDREGMLDAVAN